MNRTMKVLVTDDDPDVLSLETEALRQHGYEVLEATTGEACLQSVRTHRPDLVLLDVVLPDTTGVELSRHIKPDPDLRDTFVILTSGVRVASEYQAEGLNTGADGYIVKPLSNKELLARIQAMERIKRAEDALKTSETRYRRLFETAQDGILILDAETGQIADVNPFLEEMLGYAHEDFLGKRLWEIGAFEDIAASRAAFAELQARGYVRYEDLPLRTKGGRPVAVEFVSNVYLVDHHKVIQCNIRDITDRKPIAEAIRTEKGCRRFDFYRSVEDENALCLLEEWDTQENLKNHLKSERFRVLKGALNLLKEPYEMASHTVFQLGRMEEA